MFYRFLKLLVGSFLLYIPVINRIFQINYSTRQLSRYSYWLGMYSKLVKKGQNGLKRAITCDHQAFEITCAQQ